MRAGIVARVQQHLLAVRNTQLRLLAAPTHTEGAMPICLSELDAAVQRHMSHPAMGGADPLTDCLLAQLEAPASEGGQPREPAAAPLTDAQRRELAEASSLGAAVQWLLLGTVLTPLVVYGLAQAFQALAQWGGA